MAGYDVAVIGAGLGGLTAAAILARAGRKVLVIERSNSVGGAASSYKVGDLFVEGSLHETSNPTDPRDPKHDILARAGARDTVKWIASGALYEVRGGPLQRPFVLPDNFAEARRALIARFPQRSSGIQQFLHEMQDIVTAATGCGQNAVDNDTEAADLTTKPKPPLSLAQKFDALFGDDEAIKCALAANLSYYHDDPATLPWRSFALAQGRYLLSGGCFVHGGSQRLSSSLARAIRSAAGDVLLRRVVTGVALNDAGRPVSLTHSAKDGSDTQTTECQRIISNAAPATLAGLMPDTTAQKLTEAYAQRQPSISLFALTLGLTEPAGEFGVASYSTQLLPNWMQRLTDYAAATRLMAEEPDGRMPPLAVVNYGAIDAGIPAPPHVLSVVGPDHIANWDGLMPEHYRCKRERWQAALVTHLDAHYPGLAQAVTSSSFNTARSVQQYLNAPHGAVYGFSPAQGAGSPHTPTPGVYLASAYAGTGGYTGVIEAAGACTDIILREG